MRRTPARTNGWSRNHPGWPVTVSAGDRSTNAARSDALPGGHLLPLSHPQAFVSYLLQR